ncbi:hypothetical protein Dsin_001277 [Dipteronia sinensis]|uniref:Uncharacterized protein n=1 Tax=Dipteronia sinensis TaxID=43782 RepID=A0AAE0B431_9ROSI|nr:hypothetical protein Dsin_001277 [Dipteronia sinensis]
MLAYGLPEYAIDEYIKIKESTAIESSKRFCRAVVELFTEQYLRSPNANDVARLLCIARSGSLTIILEDVSDYDLWIWHAYFGLLGTNNDINVLESSHLLANLAQAIEDHIEGSTPEVEMIVDENIQFQEFLARHRKIKDKEAHIAL